MPDGLTVTMAVVVVAIIVLWAWVEDAHADNHTLADIRAGIISSGIIPDTYLIQPTGTYWNNQNATATYNVLQTWLDTKDESIASELFQNTVNRAMFNTAILLEGRADSIHEVVALVVAKERAQNTYSGIGYLKKYHDHIINAYDTPTTINELNTKLNQTLGDMLPLADAIKAVTSKAASIGGVPNDLLETDNSYWMGVEREMYCRLDTGSTAEVCIPTPPTLPTVIGASAQSASTAQITVQSLLNWRAYGCITSHGAMSTVVCSGSAWYGSQSGQETTHDISKTVTGYKIYAELTVYGAPRNTEAKLQLTVDDGLMQKHEVDKTGRGNFVLSGTWHAWLSSRAHPCYIQFIPADWRFLNYCIANRNWSFDGDITLDIPSQSRAPSDDDNGGTSNLKKPVLSVMGPDTILTAFVDTLSNIIHIPLEAPGGLLEYTGMTPLTQIKYDLKGSDGDGDYLTLSITDEPTPENAAIADCNTLLAEKVTLYNSTNQQIAAGTGRITDSICLVALKGTDGDMFELTLNDGKFSDMKTVNFEIIRVVDFLTEQVNKASLTPTTSIGDGVRVGIMFATVEILIPNIDAKYVDHVRIWRCHNSHYPDGVDCDAEPIGFEIPLPGVPVLRSEEQRVAPDKAQGNATGWTLMANITKTGTTIMDPDVRLLVDNSTYVSAATAARSADKMTVTLQDYGVEEGEVYRYGAYVYLAGGNRSYVPLGDIAVTDITPPTLRLLGPANMTTQLNSTYIEPGYTATDNVDGDLTANVTVTGTVDTNTPGTYKLYYNVSDSSGNAAVAQNRTVHVADTTPPVITLKGQQAMNVEGKTTYVEPGYMAFDNVDGNVTDMVAVTGTVDTSVLDAYIIHYDISDSSGNAAITQNRTVTVVDTTPPVFTLKGEVDMTIPASVPYVEPGYTSIDSVDGNVTHRVAVLGAVDVDAQASYRMAYFAGDNSGNLAPTLYRNVIVADMTPPTLTLKGDTKIWVTKGMIYTEPGYIAIDNIDGNVTSRVVVTGTVDVNMEGTYTLSYDITDRAGNAATTQNRTVTVVAGDATPIITLKGQQVMAIEEGMVYVEPGYTATDREDGDLTGNVTVTGTVDTSKIGAYSLYYDVVDRSGNQAVQQVRTVRVVDVTAPIITLTGSINMTVQANSAYADPGYAATDDYDGDLTGNVTVTGMVDVTRISTYTLHYDVSDNSGNTAIQQTRTVHVVDVTSPTITLTDPTDMTIQINSTYADPGYMAADDYDGDLTASVIVTGTVDDTQIGTYTLYYDVSDSSGNTATQQVRTIHVVAATSPTITLSGSSTMTVSFGSEYSEPGYTATDPEDGDLTASVVVTGTVNTAKIGTYTLYYDVSDSFGNKAVQQNRTVRVADMTPPTITLAGQTTMTVPVNTTYADPGYTATDNHDGDLTASVIVTGTVNATKIGTYTIYYNVVDSFGNNAIQQIRTVHVADIPDPQAGLPEVVKRYDTNRNGVIDQPEWLVAIDDYTNSKLTGAEIQAIASARS